MTRIDGWEEVLHACGEPGLDELRSVLRERLCPAGADGSLTGEKLTSGVFRLRLGLGTGTRSLVIKSLDPVTAHRSRLVTERWLPDLGLERGCPALVGVAAARSGQRVWHLYEDLGDRILDERAPDPKDVAAAVALIARVHTRSAGRPFLAECRLWGADFGISFYSTSLRDAIRGLEVLDSPAVLLAAERAALRAGLLERMHRLREEEPERGRALAAAGGPETFLHGDLWPKNVVVTGEGDGLRACLLDWDRAGVGPITYDLSTFLLRFPAAERLWILDLYREAAARAGWRLPGPSELNLLFDTAERARVLNRVVWATIGICDGEVEWGFEELARCREWLDGLDPVLPL